MKNNLYFLYYFFENTIIICVRILIFIILGILVWLNFSDIKFITSLIPFYAFFILQELFISQKLKKEKPINLNEKYKNLIECVDFKTRSILERNSQEKAILKILKENEVKYFLGLLSIKLKNSTVNIQESELLKKAFEIVKKVNGQIIHSIDILVSYLLLTESNTKLLFENNFDENDILSLFSWVRKSRDIEKSKNTHLQFFGNGAFDFFVYGWSLELSRYALNFTDEVISSKMEFPIGRNREYDLLITALSKNRASNAILVGPSGVGKTSLVRQFALDSNIASLPRVVSHKVVFKLYSERLMSGVANVGDLQTRFINLFDELLHTGNTVVYIPNIENIFGGGGINMDISGPLMDYLSSSNIKIIGSTTPDFYNNLIDNKKELKELFNIIEVAQPDTDTAIFMLLEKSKVLCFQNRVFITYDAIKSTLELSDSYINDGSALPGRAIKLLEDVIANSTTHGIKNITKNEVEKLVSQKTNIVLSKPTKKESEVLLNLENEIHKKIISQNEAVKAIADAMRRVRSGMKNEGKPIASFLFLGPTGVGKTEVSKALAASYFGSEESMIRLDMSEFQRQDAVERLLGAYGNERYEETILDKILKNPFSLILLDEFEKAHPQVLDLFLQIFDEGHLTDNRGRVVSFKQSIIIATSNAGSGFIREKASQEVVAETLKTELIENILQKNIFKPELVNRFDDVIVFSPLTKDDVEKIAALFLNELKDKMEDQKIVLTYDNNVLDFIAENAYSVDFGARNISRFIQENIENVLSKMILGSQLANGKKINLTIENNMIAVKQI